MTNHLPIVATLHPNLRGFDDQRRRSATRVDQGYEPDDGPQSPEQISVLQAMADADHGGARLHAGLGTCSWTSDLLSLR